MFLYKCLSPSFIRYFTFVNVTFNESSFYYMGPSYVSLSTIVNISVVSDLLVAPTPLLDSPPPPTLQVYSRRHHFQQPPSDSLHVLTTFSSPASTTESNNPITFCKRIRSTHNLFSYYITLCYHRLFSHFYTCKSRLFFCVHS